MNLAIFDMQQLFYHIDTFLSFFIWLMEYPFGLDPCTTSLSHDHLCPVQGYAL